MLKELISEDVQEPQTSRLFRASTVGECETWLCHAGLGHEAASMSGRVRHMLDDGSAHERDIVERLIYNGIDARHTCLEGQMTVLCYEAGGLRIDGHPDGIIEREPPGFELDYADENFRFDKGTYLLEITAPNHFSFLRVERDHVRSALWRKYVQIQMYLHSGPIHERTDCCVVEVKNKNTSALYEEGISYDRTVVDETVEKLKRVVESVSLGGVLSYRCVDWRKQYCKYRHLCFGVEPLEVEPSGQLLKGESLKEAEELLQAADLWLKGKDLVLQGEELVEEARTLFREIVEEYGVTGLTVAHTKALMVEATRRRVDTDALQLKYPEVYNDVVSFETSRYIRVTKI